MPLYKITISKTVQKQLDKLADTVADKLIVAIKALTNDPRPNGCKKSG
jgi:mRNA interferase RelE/StbE